ncbi:MAG: hypothetical protein P8165_03705 [Deltaproteobacteria bacterium]|jgi:hypothetical protein
MRNLDLYLDSVDQDEGDQKYRVNVRLSRTYDDSLTLWYAVPYTQWAYCALEPMDSFVVAALLKAMEDQATLRVHGPVSTSLLDNLEEFQLIFSLWFPDKYARIDIVADREVDAQPINNRVMLSFSGGVDGAFSALNHILKRGPIKRKRFDMNAVLYIEGFDVNIDHDAQCRAVAARNRLLLAPHGDLTFLNVRTNLKYLLSIKRFWASHACVIASAASLFRNISGGCLVGSSHSYLNLNPWGSHPLTDRLLSSNSFQIHHDMVFTRMEKLRALLQWPEALENLKVCWEGQYRYDTSPDTNCCSCDKCIRTMLAFRALGREIPSSFPDPLTPEKVRHLSEKRFDWSRLVFLIEILKTAEQAGKADDPLFMTLKEVIGDRRPEDYPK